MKMKIEIPFNSWSRERLYDERKKATSRYKKYGVVGDWFEVVFKDKDESRKYQLELVIKVPLWFVIEDLYRSEGANSSEELDKVWKEMHPKRGVRPFDEVWYHHFRELD